MSLKVNLLPEARLSTLRNKSRKRTFTTITVLSGGVVATIIIVLALLQGFLFATYQANASVLKELDTEIAKDRALEEKATTLQENLAAFSNLNNNRTYVSRVFTNLFNAIPSNVSINNFQVGNDDKVTISATTNSFEDVAKTAESLSQYNTNFKPQADLERKPVFSEVNVDSISRGDTTGETTFTISFKVDNELLKKQKEVR